VAKPPEDDLMSRTPIVARPLAAFLLGLSLACAKHPSRTVTVATSTGDVAPTAPVTPVVLTVAARPGEAVYLTDAKGRAVYYVASPDGEAVVECAGECATAFDPVTGKAIVATGDTTVQVALIGEIPRPSGRRQVTYGGKPLYYRRGEQAGATTAHGMKTAGGEASLVGPNGKKASRQ
jgi:predicted lipoprotein with Yx(FWY)xxD motif